MSSGDGLQGDMFDEQDKLVGGFLSEMKEALKKEPSAETARVHITQAVAQANRTDEDATEAPRRARRFGFAPRWSSALARAGVAAVALVAVTTGAAVAGVLPDPIQSAVANLGESVNISLPSPEDSVAEPGEQDAGGSVAATDTTTTTTTTTTTAEVAPAEDVVAAGVAWQECVAEEAQGWIDDGSGFAVGVSFDPTHDCGPPPGEGDLPDELHAWLSCAHDYLHEWLSGDLMSLPPFDVVGACGEPPIDIVIPPPDLPELPEVPDLGNPELQAWLECAHDYTEAWLEDPTQPFDVIAACGVFPVDLPEPPPLDNPELEAWLACAHDYTEAWLEDPTQPFDVIAVCGEPPVDFDIDVPFPPVPPLPGDPDLAAWLECAHDAAEAWFEDPTQPLDVFAVCGEPPIDLPELPDPPELPEPPPIVDPPEIEPPPGLPEPPPSDGDEDAFAAAVEAWLACATPLVEEGVDPLPVCGPPPDPIDYGLVP